MIIKLEKVILRPIEPGDIPFLYEYRNKPTVIQALGGFSSGYSIRDLEAWMEHHRKVDNEILWCIADKESDACIGHVGLYNIDYRVRKAELAILIGDDSWQGKGIGRAICDRVIRYGLDQLNLHRVELTVLATNERAIRLYKALGFKVEGTQKDAQFRDGEYVDVIFMARLESHLA